MTQVAEIYVCYFSCGYLLGLQTVFGHEGKGLTLYFYI